MCICGTVPLLPALGSTRTTTRPAVLLQLLSSLNGERRPTPSSRCCRPLLLQFQLHSTPRSPNVRVVGVTVVAFLDMRAKGARTLVVNHHEDRIRAHPDAISSHGIRICSNTTPHHCRAYRGKRGIRLRHRVGAVYRRMTLTLEAW